jgi:high-affinity iron transporter
MKPFVRQHAGHARDSQTEQEQNNEDGNYHLDEGKAALAIHQGEFTTRPENHNPRLPGQPAAKKWQPTGSSAKATVLRFCRELGNFIGGIVSANPRISGLGLALRIFIVAAALSVVAILVWQGVTAHGTPDPLKPHTSPTVAFLDIAVLVFREGLECILVLAAITASMVGARSVHRKPVAIGAAIAFSATLVTWFIAVSIMSQLTESVPALDLQAATGLLAVIVLLVIMNWFFHKIYWGGWIRAHNRRRKALLANANAVLISQRRLYWGFILLGFTSLYREGFEVVLFLQSYNLRLGGGVVLKGALLGLTLSALVAILTFVLQQRLPYRKMLITTGVLLGVVLLVMVGEQGQEMQLAHWIPTTQIPWLANFIPGWMGMWFAVFSTVETLAAQGLAALLVVGSYYAARWMGERASNEDATVPEVLETAKAPIEERLEPVTIESSTLRHSRV